MSNFFSLLEDRVNDISSLLCVGLDPRPADLPQPTSQAAFDFCRALVEQTAPYAAAFKPNAAFFEVFGADGWQALQRLIAFIHSEYPAPVILDAKRGDIASTAEAYARSTFELLGADAVTLSPYLGRDSLTPFLRYPGKGVFLLCKTSNPGAGDLQDLKVTPSHSIELYRHLAHLAQEWNTDGNIGLVVGATHPEALANVRAEAPGLWFLSPGIGPQGGDLPSALAAGLRADGQGMLINLSRGISQAENPAEAARNFCRHVTELGKPNSQPGPSSAVAPALRPLADALLQLECVRFGEFTLKSGQVSPIYIDLRRLVAAPRVLSLVAAAYADILRPLKFDLLAALPYAALPIGTAVSLQGDWPLIYPRKEAKTYGTKAAIEGLYRPGQRAVVLDDLITTGGSKFEGIQKLSQAGLQVEDIVVLIDRQSGGQDLMAEQGYRLHSVFTLPQLLDYWDQTGQVDTGQLRQARAFLADMA